MTTMNSSVEASTADKHTTTAGEELYLVHLRRLREEEDDHDHLPRKRRSSSIGEELWEIHQRRSVGMENDEDLDRDATHTEAKGTNQKNSRSTSKEAFDEPKCCRYNLRSRDPSIKKN